MRIDKLYIDGFGNLNDFFIDLETRQSISVLIGRNGSGKSHLLEAIATIFRDLDRCEKPTELMQTLHFKYTIEYQCHGNKIKISASPKSVSISVAKINSKQLKPITYFQFQKQKDQYLPKYIIGYYSGNSLRLQEVFRKHEERAVYRFKRDNYSRDDFRPLFFADAKHSSLLLITLILFSRKNEYIKSFLEDYLELKPAGNAFSITLKSPSWSKVGKAQSIEKDVNAFWGVKGVVHEFLNYLYASSTRSIAYKRTYRSPVSSVARYAGEYLTMTFDQDKFSKDAMEIFGSGLQFFRQLEGALQAGVIEEIKMGLKKGGIKSEISFDRLSEGEQQILTIIGLLLFTGEEESLFLLDEPDTYLNPAWKYDYINQFKKLVHDKQDVQVLITTHDPMLIAGLEKEYVLLFNKDQKGKVTVTNPEENIVGMGIEAILTSELFGLNTTLDKKTYAQMIERRELYVKSLKGKITKAEKEKLSVLTDELSEIDYVIPFNEPLYREYAKALKTWDMYEEPVLTREQVKRKEKNAKDILKELKKKPI